MPSEQSEGGVSRLAGIGGLLLGVELVARTTWVALATTYASLTQSSVSTPFLLRFFTSHVGGVPPIAVSLNGETSSLLLGTSYAVGISASAVSVRWLL